MVVDDEGGEGAFLAQRVPVLRARGRIVRHEHGHGGEQPHVVGLLGDEVERRPDPDIDEEVRLPVLDLEDLRRQVDHGPIEDDGLELGLDVHGDELLLRLFDHAHAVVRVFREDGDALEALLLDPLVPQGDAVRIDDVGAEGIGQVLLGQLLGRGLRQEHRHLGLLCQVLDRLGDGAVELSDDRHHAILADELPQSRRALFRRARVVFHDELDLASPEDAALGVDLVRRHLGAPDDELTRGGVAGRRERSQDADLDGTLGEGR